MLNKIAIFSFLIISLSACDKFQSASSNAILDLDAIAKATGQAEVIKQQIEKANQELNSQLAIISNKLNEQLDNEKKKMGKKLSKEEQKQLQQLILQANKKMQQSKTLATQKSQQYRVALIQQLRSNIKPIAEKIARHRGADIVVTANNTTIWFNPEIDITDEVIAAVRAQTPASSLTAPATQQPQSTEAAPAETEK